MLNVLYVSPYSNVRNGGSLGRSNNRKALLEISNNFYTYEISVNINIFKKIWQNLLGFKCGLNYNHIKRILSLVKEKNINCVFVDVSLYGKLIYVLMKQTKVRIVSFYHNCEYKLYQQDLSSKSFIIRSFLLRSVYCNEKLTLEYSDNSIFLTARDKNDCEKIYKFRLKNASFTPIALEDNYKDASEISKRTPRNLLFVGSYFRPNISGVIWFTNNVLPFVDYSLTIIGKGFEDQEFINKLGARDKISVLGFVQRLDSYYENCDLIVQPVFEGSGMKTKTAESFMYGKPMITTDEGIIGYEKNIPYLFVCNTDKEFINTLNKLKQDEIPSFSQKARDLYKSKYSLEARTSFYSNLLK